MGKDRVGQTGGLGLTTWGFPGAAISEESACTAEDAADTGLISGLIRSPGVGNGNPLQYSGLGNPMGRGAWHAVVHGAAKSQT